MTSRICSCAALAAIFLATAAGSIAQADDWRDYLRGALTLSTADDDVLADLSAYYRFHANVRLGPEQRLDNGVAWRLLTDGRTGAVVPRITWMADWKSVQRANTLLEAVHGAALVSFDVRDLERRRMELDNWYKGKPPNVTKPPYFAVERVAVTYATSRLVSFLEVGRNRTTDPVTIGARGLVLDLERSQIKELESCRNSAEVEREFRLGEWLEVCTEAAADSFKALWADKMRQAMLNAGARRDELLDLWSAGPEAAKHYSTRWAIYLTPTGLAMFDKAYSDRRYGKSGSVVVNPIILPYRDLEPFMKPGPWRDELLNQPSSRTP